MDKARILIVEDDADNGRSLVDAIEDIGYASELTPTAQEGIAAFQARGADVVLADLVLPDRDGIAVLQAIRDRDAGRTPVILMTAYASVETSVRAMKEGAYDYLQKPLDIDELQTKLARALEAARLRRQVAELSQEIRG
ncbi:MAG: response regulator, partial [Kiritimatiellae bacterium]|nr:response regulator [Kiritimatiellia bacterium]